MQKLYLNLMLSLTSSTIYATQTLDSITQKEEALVIDNAINTLLDQGLAQLKHVEHILEKLALLVYSEGHKFSNKKDIRAYIIKTRQLINDVKNNSFLTPELGTTSIINLINLELTKNLTQAINSNQWIPITDIGLLIQRHQDTIVDFAQIQLDQQELQTILTTLDNEIERFGLTRSQRTIHDLEDKYEHLKAFTKKHSGKIKFSIYSSAALLYLNYQSDNLPDWVKKITDRLPHMPHPLGKAPAYKESYPETGRYQGSSMIGIPVSPQYLSEDNVKNNYYGLGKWERTFSRELSTDFSPQVLIPGAALGYAAHNFMEDPKATNYMLIGGQLGVHLIPNPTVRMAALSYDLFQLQGSNKFEGGKIKLTNWFRKHYYSLRGEQITKELTKKPILTFADLIGQSQSKEFEVVVDYIINPDKYERTKLTPAKGYLMVGPPRTGKSFLAQAICGEINARRKLLGKPAVTNFISLDADLIQEKSFYTLMEFINSKAPCVVFIDEIDLLCLNRGDGNKENKLLSQLLTHMSGYIDSTGEQQNRQVIFIGATNNPYLLDDALVQPGRFGKIISFEYPHLELREQYIMRELDKRCITTLSPEFITSMAKELEGYTFEDMELLIISALQIAGKTNDPVGESQFQLALDGGIKTILPDSKPLSDREIDAIATYQAGKALATRLLVSSRHISTLTTMPIKTKIESRKDSKVINQPIIQYGGIFTYKNTDLLNLQSNRDLELHCQIMLAGHIAQELLTQECYYNYRPEDQQLAYNLAQQIVLEGRDYSKLTEGLQEQVLEQAHQIKINCRTAIHKLLVEHTDKINLLRDQLKAKRHLREKDILDLIG